MKNLWEKIKAWLLAKWAVLKVWFKANWMVVVNYLVILLAYNNVYGKEGTGFAEVLLGLWIFVSAAYGLYKLFSK